MIERDKLFVIAENMDDSIQSQVAAYDVTIFKTFTEFEAYVNKYPVTVEDIVISERVLPFTGQNMARVIAAVNLPFLTLRRNVVYLIGKETSHKNVSDFLDAKNIQGWAVYQGDLSVKFITDIIIGNGRQSNEGLNEVVTYRIRATDYIKQQNQLQYQDNSKRYMTDDDLLSGIPDIEVPEEIKPSEEHYLETNYIVGDDCIERTLMVFLLAQYFSMSNRTLVIEKDSEYHMLGEILTKSGIEHDFIEIEDLYKDSYHTIETIISSPKRLVFVGTKNRKHYDYNFIFDILKSNLKGIFDHIIRECDYDETPYGQYYTIVTQNTIPAILKCCNKLKYDLNPEMVTFVGLQASNLGPINITSAEMKSIAEIVLNKNNVMAQVIHINGLLLKGDSVVYDIFGILNRGNQ